AHHAADRAAADAAARAITEPAPAAARRAEPGLGLEVPMTAPRRWALAAAATILAWCGLELAVRRPSAITDDWQGWRPAAHPATARIRGCEESTPLAPRIDWRGDGPGYVETELKLYPTLIAIAMRATGESVWPGQLISLACVALAAWILFAA